MVSAVLTMVVIVLLMWMFDFSALKNTKGKKTWVTYIGITGIGFVFIGVYLTIFNPPGSLLILQRLLEPISGWLAT